MLSSSDEFSVATPDETTGKETEFSLVGSLEIKKKKLWIIRTPIDYFQYSTFKCRLHILTK